jgi:hypothetical protein
MVQTIIHRKYNRTLKTIALLIVSEQHQMKQHQLLDYQLHSQLEQDLGSGKVYHAAETH